MKNYAEMTVKELKNETKERGMTMEHKGHKFTKQELIDRLVADDASVVKTEDMEENTEQFEEDDYVSEVVRYEETSENKETQPDDNNSENDNARNTFATTFDEIVEKYSYRRSEWFYNSIMIIGNMAVFPVYGESVNGNLYKKIRTGKIVGVNRKKELVRCETLLGDTYEVAFEDILFVKKSDTRYRYPIDIREFLRNQRTKNGSVKMYEAFRHKSDTEEC